ncbi:MAG: helix-turn-helix domain-containing protein [Alphaproteobacteria bacterium]
MSPRTILLSEDDTVLIQVGPRGPQAANENIPQSIESFLTTQFRNYFAAHEGRLPPDGLYERVLARFEKPLIAETLKATGGNQLRAAAVLGINRNTLRKKMRALSIDPHTGDAA